jgi:hypothetical protein
LRNPNHKSKKAQNEYAKRQDINKAFFTLFDWYALAFQKPIPKYA